jgi:hypothetical protein
VASDALRITGRYKEAHELQHVLITFAPISR